MNGASATLLAATLGLSTLAGAAIAQTPLGGDNAFLALPASGLYESQPKPVCDAAGVCAYFWFVSDQGGPPTDLFAMTVSPLGQLLSGPKHVSRAISFPVGIGLEHGFAFITVRLCPEDLVCWDLHEVDQFLRPVLPPARLPEISALGITPTPSGYTVLAASPFVEGESQAALYFIDRRGSETRPPLFIANTFSVALGNLAVQPNGDLLVVYLQISAWQPRQTTNVVVLRLAPDGTSLGPEALVYTETDVPLGSPSIANGPDGSFLVVWQRASDVETTNTILARRCAADGTPLGDAFPVSDRPERDQRYPQITSDVEGNYFVTWQAFLGGVPGVLWDIEGRLFRHDGTPVTHQIRLNQDRRFEQEAPLVAFAPNGIVVAGWHSQSPRQGGPVVRRFAASPGPEICATWGLHLRCDLARTGGAMELQLTVPNDFGEVALLGDIDGDGRDDVCSYLNGRFHCDLSHQNVPPGWSERFGSPGDVPLLGDVDGDGKADPCVRRKSFLVCDTRHDGTESYRLQLGHGGETPLLGDLDSDGKADLCLVEDGRFWSCRLSATGAPLKLTFGRPGDSPALGDVNRDSKADPCLLRKGRLSCNTKHDGGAADYTLQLDVPAGARLLFANLDGL